MKPIERILAAVDFSVSSEEALKTALYLGQAVKGRVKALHVVSQTPFQGHFFGELNVGLVNQIEQKAVEELDRRVQRLKTGNQEVESLIQVGVPFIDLVRYAKQHKIHFMVAGSQDRGWGERVLLGSVAEGLMRKSSCPVWIVKKKFHPPKKILILTDLSENSRAGFTLGLFLARLLETSVHLLHVFEFPQLPSFLGVKTTEIELKMREMVREEFQKWVQEASTSKLQLTSELAEGNPKIEVEKIIQKQEADLLVMSTHGESGLFHQHLGSLTNYLARHASCSLITVRPEGFRFKEI